MHIVSFSITLCVLLMISETISMNWLKFSICAGTDSWTCSGGQLRLRYNEMYDSNCKNCDKYFHCQGNYDAVYRCVGNTANNRHIAAKISDCREKAQDASTADSRADQVANKFGRDGHSCEAAYLCKVQCKYNPRDKTCRRENCP